MSNLNINLSFIIFFVVFTIRNIAELFLKPKLKDKIVDGKFSVFIILMMYFVIGLSVMYYLLGDNKVSVLQLVAGLLFFIFAFYLRIVILKNMKGSYSLAISPNTNSTLIKSGFHSIIRHPVYLTSIIEYSGLGIVRFNWIATLALLTCIIVIIYRIKNEEKALIKRYGDEYLDYMKNTKCILPFIW